MQKPLIFFGMRNHYYKLPSKSFPNLGANRRLSPYQHKYGKIPNFVHLYIYERFAHVHVHNKQKTKLDSKLVNCIMIGYSKDTKGYKCYNLVSH